jgi:predicted ATP-grasp superfamily ATP-dependent carboligase
VPLIDSHKTSSRRGASVLIAAISGRALARAAAEAGYTPLVADFFADLDAHELAHACRKMPGAIGGGFQWQSLAPALVALADSAPSPVCGLVYGSGFEDRPHLLTRIAERWPLLGNDASTVARIKAPETFFATLSELGIAHPETMTTRPPAGAGWVSKRRGGAGGSHITPDGPRNDASDVYYQELVQGRAVSVLFVADGADARVLGFSEQWTAPAPGRPWRYGGAVRPASLTETASAEMARAAVVAARAFGLRGLASADFVLTGNQFYLLEINPRPGATLDIYTGAETPLFALHVDALLNGHLPPSQPAIEGACASAIVFAPQAFGVPQDMIWPSWAADVPKPGERIDKQRPICTVLARAGTERRAKLLAETRKASVLAKIQNKIQAAEGNHREQ